MSHKLPRRPAFAWMLIGFLPAIALTLAAGLLPAPWPVLPLVLAQSLAIAASCHAFGRLADPGQPGMRIARLVTHALLLGFFAAWLWLLTAWPLTALEQVPTLGASVLLSIALLLVLASLWSWWPLLALPLLTSTDNKTGTQLRNPLGIFRQYAQQARHISAKPDLLFTHMLPAGCSQLLAGYCVLALSGMAPLPGLTAGSLSTLALFALVLLPLTSLITTWSCIRALQPADPARAADEKLAAAAQSTPRPSLKLVTEDTLPGRREQALIEAARAADIERALALLAADANPDATPGDEDHDRRSVMVLATLLPDTRLLRALIAHGGNIQGTGSGLAPLLIATRDNRQPRSEAIMTLLANGADARVHDGDGNTALHFAALNDDAEVAAMLLDAGAVIDTLNRSGHTPLALACRAGKISLIGFLLDRKAHIEVESGEPALVSVADMAHDDVAVVKLLLKHRAKVNACDVLGRSALNHAALSGHAGMTAALLDAGADINLVDQRGTTALMEAARAGANTVLTLLAEHQPDIGQRDIHGRDALLLACQSPRADAETVRILLALGADPKRPGQDGRHALDHATSAGRWNLVALLDPDSPLPSSHCHDLAPEPGADSPEHLLDALRFGHWAAVSGFQVLARQWPQEQRVALYMQLLEPDQGQARQWLFDHGLDVNARSNAGQILSEAVLSHLPGAAEALHELLNKGLGIAGRGLLADAMSYMRDAATGAALIPKLIERDGDLFGTDAAGMTPLHHAASHGMLHTLQLLLARGCDPNVRDANGQTPLHHALHNDSALAVKLLRALIRHGGNPEATDATGETPLGQALDSSDDECATWLRWSTWRLPGRPLRESDLPDAAAVGDAEAVSRLLELGLAVNTPDAQGATALLRACGGGHLEAARRLLAAGADTHLSTPGGATALTAAVTSRHADLVKLLLEHGADTDQRLHGGATALLVSAALGHAEIAELLLNSGANVHAVDRAGRNALHAAAQYGFGCNNSLAARRVLDVLIQHGAQARQTDHAGASPLLFMLGAHTRPGTPCDATHIGALLPALLDAGASPSGADQRGVSPLHACAMHALIGPARLLLSRGAERDARDSHDRTAADVARLLGFVDVARELGSHDIPGATRTLRRPAQDGSAQSEP